MQQKIEKTKIVDQPTLSSIVSPTPKGKGPGLLLVDDNYHEGCLRKTAQNFSEEGYCVSSLALPSSTNKELLQELLLSNIEELKNHQDQAGKVGAIFYINSLSSDLLEASAKFCECTIIYSQSVPIGSSSLDLQPDSTICHQTTESKGHSSITNFVYADQKTRFFDCNSDNFDKPSASIAYSRTLGFLKRKLGPIYDLQELWEQHTMFEFSERNVDKTMDTMVSEPYVNHIPTMTGGVGYEGLHHFYTNHFVNSNPPDTKLIPVSRTVGVDRLVDEMIFCFTHTCEIPWMLPSVKPTNRYVEVPLVAIVNFRGNKLYHEHIYWDQASVLVQIGKIDPALLPVVGIDSARKLLNENLPSNELINK